MKKKWILTVLLFGCMLAFAKAQTVDPLGQANNYFDQGEFKKALLTYKRVFKNQPNNTKALLGIILSHQQLEEYKEAELVIEAKRVNQRYKPMLTVELGYNYQLQEKDSLAQIAYKEAIDIVRERPNTAYAIGNAFQNHNLLEEAVQTYELAAEINPKINYSAQLARIYGELGDIEKMFDAYLYLINKNTNYIRTAQRNFNQYITDDSFNEANVVFRKLLLKKLQSDPNVLYNELLSWLFIQQKDYKKAFTQEKAIYKRNGGDLSGVIDLAGIVIEEEELSTARDILIYVKETTLDTAEKLRAEQELQKINLKEATTKEQLQTIRTQYESLLATYGTNEFTVPLQIDYAHFLAFNLEEPQEGIDFLKKSLKNRISRFDEVRLKMELADILVLEEKFNQALIYYSQIQNKVKNNVLAQEARFKVARTSYYKGDFPWAETQLNVLKASATQLIANDALELLLTIRDNSQEDSLQTGLKKYAKADLLGYQNKRNEAIALYEDIIETHKTESIEDEALLALAALYEEESAFAKAKTNYIKIIEFFGDGILADDAHYRLAKLYEGPLQEPEKAKQHYERIIFDFADSIYFVDAQKRYRTLRGDAIN